MLDRAPATRPNGPPAAPPRPDLSHIPAPWSLPVVGHTPAVLRDPYGLHRAMIDRFGPVYRLNALAATPVYLHGPDAVERVLTDPERAFSSRLGWRVIAPIFPGGLMLRDFEDHRAHRRVMQQAFRAGAMRDYLALMGPAIARRLDAWPAGETVRLYPRLKRLTLEVGSAALMGLDDPAEAAAMNRAFMAEVAASVAVVRLPIPGTRWGRGLAARRRLRARFGALVAARRAGAGRDLFSELCRAEAAGEGWSAAEIVDHFNFLMMAAHDTTTTALAVILDALARDPALQSALRDEFAALGPGTPGMEALGALDLAERVFREALRLVPPVPFIPRRALRAFEHAGVTIPAGADLVIAPGLVHRDPAIWTDPLRFDPDRFAAPRHEDRAHRFAYAPFGGGAHKCIGMHFAQMEVKAVLHRLLARFEIAPAGPPPGWAHLPIPKPRDGLPVRLTARA